MATRQAIREQLAKQLGDTAYANYTQDYLNGLINQALEYGYPAIAQVVEDESIVTNDETVSASTISFTATTNVIADSANGLAGFHTGDTIWVTGSTSNDGRYTVKTGSTAAQIVVNENLTTEIAGDDVTITCDSSEYAIPAAAKKLVGDVYIETGDGVAYSVIRNWHEENGRLRLVNAPAADMHIRITYVSPYPALSTDGETTQVSEDYIVAYCQREIWANKASDPSHAGDMGLATAMYDRFIGLTEQLRNERRTPRPMPRSKHIWRV